MDAGLNANLELQCRETMEKHLGAGFEAGVEGLKAWKLEQDNMTKKADFFFWSSKRKKKQARKNRTPPVQDSSRTCC